MFTKKLMAAATVAVASLGFATSAQAFTNVTVGDDIYGELVSPTIALGSFSSCTDSSVSGHVSVDNGVNAGGAGPITSASFSGCQVFGSSATVTANLPWGDLAVNGAGAMTLNNVDVNLRWGFLNCVYEGDLTGAYNETTGNVVLAGTMDQTGGSGFCPDDAAVQGTYNVTDENGDPVEL